MTSGELFWFPRVFAVGGRSCGGAEIGHGLDQIAALPLGGRIKLNAWDSHIELIKIRPEAVTWGRGKMPLEVTPFFPRLTRYGTVGSQTASVNPATPH